MQKKLCVINMRLLQNKSFIPYIDGALYNIHNIWYLKFILQQPQPPNRRERITVSFIEEETIYDTLIPIQ